MFDNVYFLHQIKHNKTTGAWDKGIVVKDTEGEDNLSAAKQSYHAYLGAYAYGHDPSTDYVCCQVTNMAGTPIYGCEEMWCLPEVTPEEPEILEDE